MRAKLPNKSADFLKHKMQVYVESFNLIVFLNCFQEVLLNLNTEKIKPL